MQAVAQEHLSAREIMIEPLDADTLQMSFVVVATEYDEIDGEYERIVGVQSINLPRETVERAMVIPQMDPINRKQGHTWMCDWNQTDRSRRIRTPAHMRLPDGGKEKIADEL